MGVVAGADSSSLLLDGPLAPADDAFERVFAALEPRATTIRSSPSSSRNR
jgi:hypothetical protein